MNRVARWNVIVLGGGDPGDEFAAAHGVKVKPLIPLGGHPQAAYVLRALHQSGCTEQLIYVGPTTPELEPLITTRVTDRGQLLSNLEAGLAALTPKSTADRVMVVTADIPLITAQQVRDLLNNAPNAALVYPIVRRERCEEVFPGVRRTYARLKEGTFTGGNLFLCDPKLVHQFMPRLRAVLAARKSPLKLAGLIGLGILGKLLTRQLTVPALEAKISQLLGVPARALITPHAAIGTDVDKESDLMLAERVLAEREAQAG